MKLTEKYCLCDLCSKVVEKENMNSVTRVFDGNIGKSYLVQFVKLSRISTLFSSIRSGNLLKKDIDILYFCPECCDFILSRNRIDLVCLDSIYIRGLVEKIDNFLPQILENKVEFHESPVSNVMAILIDNSLQEKLSFAKAKNNKLAAIYFAGINVLIKDSLSEEKEEGGKIV